MASPESPPILSPTGIIHVLGYTPKEGEPGVPITVRIHFQPDLADAMYVRLVCGTKAVPTKVKHLPAVAYGRWQLHAAAPPVDPDNTTVLLSVQALSEDNTVLDSVVFGQFTYWATGRKLPRLHIPDSTTSMRRRSVQLLTPSPTTSDRPPFPKNSQRSVRPNRRGKSQSLVRTKQSSAQDDRSAQTPILDLVTPLPSICLGWSTSELAVGRRLVRFTKVQDGRRLIVSCESIPQDEYCEHDAVISCIYRQETDMCYVTSVDVIYLLERLTNGDFPVEEKNRIRRNLEGLRPTTVSKHKAGSSDFFQRIMEFPDPKPRNIEKDLKVFDWNLLASALEKILSKYSIYTSPPPDSADSSPLDTPVSSQSPELYAPQISYPPPEEPRFLDQKVPKFEPFLDEFSIPGTSRDAFDSPVDSVITTSSSASSSPSAFPLLRVPESPSDHATSDPHWPGISDYPKTAGDIALEQYSIYAVEPNPDSFPDSSALDFNLYDSYAFPQSISDDTLGDTYM